MICATSLSSRFDLTSQAKRLLSDAAQIMREHPDEAISIAGHTDSSGMRMHNQDLSERRAGSVMSYIVGGGVDPARITALGYGENHPIADNGTDEGRRLNRRVDILLKAKVK